VISDAQHSADQSTEQHLVSTEQAARTLGVTVLTVRRRIRRGELAATEVRGRFGKEWLVDLGQRSAAPSNGTAQHEAAPSNGTEQHDAATRPSDAQHGAAVDQHRADQDRSVPALVELVTALTVRTERLENERAELYGRLGYLQSELEQSRAQVRALQAPREPLAPPPPAGAIFRPLPAEPDPPRRSWWKFW
jgi:excisionase family DNA binding protein